MKIHLTTSLVLTVGWFASTPAIADAPPNIPVQGYLTDAADQPIDGATQLDIAIYADATAQTPLFSETQTIDIDQGAFTLYIGAVNTLSLDIFRDYSEAHLGITVGTDAEMRVPFGTAGYAAYSQHTATHTHDFATDLTSVPSGLDDGDDDTTYTAAPPLALNGTQFGLSTCPPTQVLKYSGNGWACADDLSASYSAASPLVLNGTVMGLSGCTNQGEVLQWNGSSWACQANADNQTLTFTDPMLSIEDGNSVDLSSLVDAAADILTKLLTVDGAGSGLDADLLDGLEAADIIAAGADENRTEIDSIPYTISQPGSYVLTQNLTNTTANGDGITIDANFVTLDLGGFSLFGDKDGVGSDDGIVVLGDQDSLHIYNGHVDNWGGDGINALNADHSLFENLIVTNNNGDGLVTDFNCVISKCSAFLNGLDGLEGDDGTVIIDSSASENGDNGIQASEGCVVSRCGSFNNESDGIDVAAGSVVVDCATSDNTIFGIDLALGGSVQGSVAYDNQSNGFDIASSCVAKNNSASLNNGHGFRTFANSYLINNKSHENDLDGIRISSTDCLVENNSLTDNDLTGIEVTSSGSLIIRNRAAGNLTNYNIITTTAFGPIVDVTSAGDISSVANADHPYANFIY